jgi:hypothetical protein
VFSPPRFAISEKINAHTPAENRLNAAQYARILKGILFSRLIANACNESSAGDQITMKMLVHTAIPQTQKIVAKQSILLRSECVLGLVATGTMLKANNANGIAIGCAFAPNSKASPVSVKKNKKQPSTSKKEPRREASMKPNVDLLNRLYIHATRNTKEAILSNTWNLRFQ